MIPIVVRMLAFNVVRRGINYKVRVQNTRIYRLSDGTLEFLVGGKELGRPKTNQMR